MQTSGIIGHMTAAPEPICVSATLLAQMFLYLNTLGVDVDGFLRSLGLQPAEITSPDSYIPVDTYLMIQEEAARLTNDPCFGLHMGEYAEAGSWSILGYLMMNCKTLGEAFEKSGRYARIIGNMIEAKAELHAGFVRVVLFTPPHTPQMSRHCYEAALSSSVRMMRTLSGVQINPLRVTFSYPQPESTAEYGRVFCCPVLFGQKQTSMDLEWGVARLPVRMANPALLEHFERYAQEFLAEMEQHNAYTRAVTRIILERLDDEKLSLPKVAKEMSLSVRTLQKRLEEEGVVFSDLLNEIRQRLAKKYLRENYPVEQITYLLGFSQPSVFRKAFKKWSGLTPRQYREHQQTADSRPGAAGG